jgi:hypothetical protein
VKIHRSQTDDIVSIKAAEKTSDKAPEKSEKADKTSPEKATSPRKEEDQKGQEKEAKKHRHHAKSVLQSQCPYSFSLRLSPQYHHFNH